MNLPWWFLAAVGWVGHAYLWTGLLNNLYGRKLPKAFLRPWRLLTGLVIAAGVPLIALAFHRYAPVAGRADLSEFGPLVVRSFLLLYLLACVVTGGLWLPYVTLARSNPVEPALVAERTDTLRLWQQLGRAALGDGKMRWAARLPLTDVFTVEVTHQTLAVPGLPAAWDGLTVLLVSDLHFHGTPSRAWFDAVFDHLCSLPTPDFVVMAGDVVDTDAHHTWIQPLLGRLSAVEGKLAVLGNHDAHHQPAKLRAELRAAGYTVLGTDWLEATVRGEPLLVLGHEGPWFDPPLLRDVPKGVFRLCVSHTPDNFPWAARNGFGLTLSGHVHGGQVRLPLVGSIFVPSVFGRRFDQGVHQIGRGVLAVGRGLSGKEPLRVRCRPQVLRLTLRPAETR